MSFMAETVPFEYWRTWWESSKFGEAMLAGACAGFCCDSVLFPLDTLKTRLQAPGGLATSGGFRGVYAGLGVTLLGSVPCSGLFFATFEAAVPLLDNAFDRALASDGIAHDTPARAALRHCLVNGVAAATGEFVAATIRTPIEALKQRRQSGTFCESYKRFIRAKPSVLWHGWTATLARDVPFSMIQYPLYHAAKCYVAPVKPIEPWRAALCGSLTSAIAAALTTPFDVVQTRVMLARVSGDARQRPHIFAILAALARERRGGAALFAGVVPRTCSMGLGGLIFLGSYEQAKLTISGLTASGHERPTHPLIRRRTTEERPGGEHGGPSS